MDSSILHMEGIAVVGLAAQLPSGDSSSVDLNYDTFWNFLVTGQNAYEPLKNYISDFSHPHVNLPERGTFLKQATTLDNISLGISTKDARVTPYSARRLLDLSFQALLDAGIDSRGRNIGCFVSANRPLQGQAPIDPDGSVSSWMAHSIANRISYALDLTGPSIYLDTACSSSLTTLHLAVGALERGECDAALVGAAQINRDPFEWASYAQAGGILSDDGISRPFDASAAGFGRGEGAVVIVLKRLRDALRDRDSIYSVVLGSAINATGSRMPPNMPNGLAQQRCIVEAYRRAGVSPKDADYVELHATGTPVGDPMEANAAAAIFGGAQFGSVKGNIGHLEVTAFLASLVKACLMFKHGVIPPTVNLSRRADTIGISVPVEPTPLGCRNDSGRSIISISAFALGGSTGHVVLQAPPIRTEATDQGVKAPILFLVGGLSSSTVEQISRGVSDMPDDRKRLAAVKLSRRARQLPWRTYFTIPASPRIAAPTLIPRDPAPLVFVFSGQGPQHLEMGRQLYADFPVFRNTVVELDEVYHRVKGFSLIESTGLFTPSSTTPSVVLPDGRWPAVITLSSIAMVQIALFDLLQSVGFCPDMIIGHSAGETAVLYASGAGSKQMAMEIAIARGDAMSAVESRELGMAVVGCNAERAQLLIQRVVGSVEAEGILEVSCLNAPESVSVSGVGSFLDRFVELAKEEGVFAQRLRTMVPVHSSFMDPIKEEYIRKMEAIFARYPGPHAPFIPVYSTSSQDRLVEAFTPSYFWDNCRKPVLFSKAVSHANEGTPAVFLEISCHPVLASSILAQGVSDTWVLCPMRRMSTRASESQVFLDTLGRLSLLGCNSIDLSGLYGPSDFKDPVIDQPLVVRDIPLPKTFFQGPIQSTAHVPLLSTSGLSISTLSHPTLPQLNLNGQTVLPASALIELLIESGAHFLWDVEFISDLVLPAEVSLERMDDVWSVRSEEKREHARGLWDSKTESASRPRLDYESIFDRLPQLGVNPYSQQLPRVIRCHGGPSEAIAEIQGLRPDELSDGYLLHPVIMDACLQILHHPNTSKQYSTDVVYVPCHIQHFTFHRPIGKTGLNWISHIRLGGWTPDSRTYDILITDSSGEALCEFQNLTVRKITCQIEPLVVKRRFDLEFQPVGVEAKITALNLPKCDDNGNDEIQRLYETLDRMAGEILAETSNRSDRWMADAQQLRDNWPYHFEIIGRIAATHGAGWEQVKNALYADDLLPNYYLTQHQIRDQVAATFRLILGTLRKAGKKFIKILDVGDGPRFLTSTLIDEINRNDGLIVEYFVTDVSLVRGKKIKHGSIIPSDYDVIRAHSETYDVIVTRYLHTAGPHQSLTCLHDSLFSGGILLSVEHDAHRDAPGSTWGRLLLACLTGSIDLLGRSEWQTRLEVTGFTQISRSDGSGSEFVLIAQKSLSPAATASHSTALDTHLFSYGFGKEIELQSWLRQLDPEATEPVYVLALAGRDADAALGLCAVLRQEMPGRNIRLAVFESPTDLADPHPLLIQHLGVFEQGEDVVLFTKNRVPHVPRVVLSPPPSRINDPEQIKVRITQWAGLSHLYDGFIGKVVESQYPGVPTGACVGGVVVFSSLEVVAIHINHLVIVPAFGPEQMLDTVIRSLMDPSSFGSKIRVLVAIQDDRLCRLVEQLVSPSQLTPVDFRDSNRSERLDVLVSDSETISQYPHLRRWIPRSGKLLLWDELFEAALSNDPAYIGRVLGDAPVQVLSKPHAAPPFRADHAYLLLGGIGGLGLDLAVWMYQNGARHLILTSRRGLDSLDPVKDALDRAKIEYLQSQDDLDVRLVQSDATDVNQMAALVRSLSAPLAGCFLMTMVVSDALFFNQTPDTFRSVYDSKIRAFEVFAGQVDIGTLDFFVALSSISGLVGLVGQSNYASACTALDGALARYSNAFSLITPGILDAGYIVGLTPYITAERDQGTPRWRTLKERTFLLSESRDLTFLMGTPFRRTNRTDSANIVQEGLSPMTTQDLWVHLSDGLAKIDDEVPFNQYIPDFDWDSVARHFNLPETCRALASPTPTTSVQAVPRTQGVVKRTGDGILAEILDLLEVSRSDFDCQQPLTVYGLDSIGAAKVAAILRPYASFSQLQLLGSVSWSEIDSKLQFPDDIETLSSPKDIAMDFLHISPDNFSTDIPLTVYGLDADAAPKLAEALRPVMPVTAEQLTGGRTFAELIHLSKSPADTPLIEICSGPGIPIIALPGANGTIGVFYALQEHVHGRGGFWAFQMTESTPDVESLPALLGFWKAELQKRWPHGPYRLAGYSASSLLAVALAKMMEDDGEEVLQVILFDHFPLLWTRLEAEITCVKKPTAQFVDRLGDSILEMLRNDPTIGPEIVANYEAAVLGTPNAPAHSRLMVKHWRAVVPLLWEFLQQFLPCQARGVTRCFSGNFNAWMTSLTAPLLLIVAEYGIRADSKLGEWLDLGASRSSKAVRVFYFDGVGHFGIFGDERVAAILTS
ncbi:hypothetical protein FB45DRAFT_1024384 [Roridomyces roridus]|uniref:Polyketide synthase n=1 Tax=Roridomyces roridus TaxID=1738132 RepID=A0AAD7FS26_9AGAR|nr:hypothetical protein FB45DRAFT_1024384 [Roridomyces roridus]